MKPYTNLRSVVIYLLLSLASVHCVASIFFTNYSWLDLDAYEHGTERMPYQGRIGMIPVLRFADNSLIVHRVVDRINGSIGKNHKKSAFQGMTAPKLACMVAAGGALLVMVGVGVFYGWRRFPRFWWLPSTLLLAMLYVTQAARYETPLWYPYDLPHAALFGIACLFILNGKWQFAFLFFLLDTPVRETSLFLAAVTFTTAWGKGQRKQGALWAGLMAISWIAFRVYITHHFAGSRNDAGIYYHDIIRLALNPIHWPQMASAFGFLLLPLALESWRLNRMQRYFLLGALPCLLVSLAYGIWFETRIFNEWLLPAAVLLTAEISHFFHGAAPDVPVEQHTTRATLETVLLT